MKVTRTFLYIWDVAKRFLLSNFEDLHIIILIYFTKPPASIYSNIFEEYITIYEHVYIFKNTVGGLMQLGLLRPLWRLL